MLLFVNLVETDTDAVLDPLKGKTELELGTAPQHTEDRLLEVRLYRTQKQ